MTNLGAVSSKLLWCEPGFYCFEKLCSAVAVVPGDKAVTLSEAGSTVAEGGWDLISLVWLAQGAKFESHTTARLPSN